MSEPQEATGRATEMKCRMLLYRGARKSSPPNSQVSPRLTKHVKPRLMALVVPVSLRGPHSAAHNSVGSWPTSPAATFLASM